MTCEPKYLGSIDPISLMLAAPDVYARIRSGEPITQEDGEALKASPFLVNYESL